MEQASGTFMQNSSPFSLNPHALERIETEKMWLWRQLVCLLYFDMPDTVSVC